MSEPDRRSTAENIDLNPLPERNTRITATAVLILIVGHFIPHGAMADKPDETKVLERFVGTWKIDETKKTELAGCTGPHPV
jgi:hypothetical protein